MKITGISVYKVELPIKSPVKGCDDILEMAGGRSWTSMDSTVVRVDTDAGISGYGEVCPSRGFSSAFPAGVRATLQEVAPSLIGLNPLEVDRIQEILDYELVNQSFVKCPIDVACWDILGKSANLPLYTLLGGKSRKSLELYCGITRQNTEDLLKEALYYKEEGYKKMQMKLSGDCQLDITNLRAVREAVGDDMAIFADANTAYSSETALRVIRATSDLGLIFEQPCLSYQRCLQVRRATGCTMILDESVGCTDDILKIHRDCAADFVKVKLCRLGGITPARKMRDLCASLGIQAFIETCWDGGILSSASTHLAQSTSERCLYTTFNFLSCNYKSVAEPGFVVDGVSVSALNKPGLGVTPKVDVLGDPVFRI